MSWRGHCQCCAQKLLHAPLWIFVQEINAPHSTLVHLWLSCADSWFFCFSLYSFFSRTAISRLNKCKCFKMGDVCLQFDCLCYMRSLCGCAVSLSLCVWRKSASCSSGGPAWLVNSLWKFGGILARISLSDGPTSDSGGREEEAAGRGVNI